MTDVLSPPDRRKNMQAIRSTNTKLEARVSKALWTQGIRFRKNVKDLPGKPDIAIKKYKIVIFLDSCFWHYCPIHGNLPKTNHDFWAQKLYNNVKRDYKINHYYYEKGWNLLRVWEHQINDDFEKAISGMLVFIKNSKVKNEIESVIR